MNQNKTPGKPQSLPEPLRASETGTFTEYSVVQRLPDIARRTLAENHFPPRVVSQLEKLIHEIPDQSLAAFRDDPGPDIADWNRYLAEIGETTWRNAPWFLAENYFYRRILSISGYFQPGVRYLLDPFAHQKRAGLEEAQVSIAALAARLQQVLAGGWGISALMEMLAISLWANQVDLSLWPAYHANKPDHASPGQAESHLLVDDRNQVAESLARPAGRVDFLCDNAGFELVCDLALADFLLTPGQVQQVVFHVKAHPTFVSDALAGDVESTIEQLMRSENMDVAAFGKRLAGARQENRLVLRPDYFWNSPLPLWEIPGPLLAEMTAASLVISKGDANYRRVLGDRHWSFTEPFHQVVQYFPVPLLALRTLKSEIIIGLQPDQLPGESGCPEQKDPQWLIDGRWGIIQFSPGSSQDPWWTEGD